MLKDITRILIENMLDQLWKQAQDSPERAARNLIDLGLQFSKGTFQKNSCPTPRNCSNTRTAPTIPWSWICSTM